MEDQTPASQEMMEITLFLDKVIPDKDLFSKISYEVLHNKFTFLLILLVTYFFKFKKFSVTFSMLQWL